MTVPKLPPLPVPENHGHADDDLTPVFYYTTDQLHAYAAQAVAEERERCAKLCDDFYGCEAVAKTIRAGS